MPTYIQAQSKTGYDRRYEDKVFPKDTKCIEMIDYIGTGGPPDENGEITQGEPGNYFGVRYCRSESFYRCFANATFSGPCIVTIGEFPAEAYDERGEAITDKTINMAASFRDSDLEILPHGCSRYMIHNTNNMFDGCSKLRSWTPQEMVGAGIAGVNDPAAPHILRSNGLAEAAFLFNLAPQTMKKMFADCVSYNGRAINVISWANLRNENAASGFAEGCTFDPVYLNGIIASLHWEFFVKKTVRTPLLDVNLGSGVVSGETAKQARELIDAGVQLTGFEIKG